MEESLLFPESQGLLLWADFTDVLDDSKNASVTLRMLIFPFGRCMVISPPSQENSGNFKPNRLAMGFNDIFLNQSKLRLFFMDNRNSPKFNPDDMEMVGNQIEIELGHSVISLFRTRISRFEHVTGDPHFDCTVYTTDYSYEDCIRRELKETFQNIIGCQPPPFAYDLNNICDQKLNLSHDKVAYIDSMFWHLYWKDFRSHCKTPCSKSKYTTRLSTE